MMDLAYQLTAIEFSYGKEFVLQIPKLDINAGSMLGITGANGSGKTTLLKILAFLLMPQTGKIKYFNNHVTTQTLPELRQQTTLLLQDTLLLKRTVFENIAYGLKIRKTTQDLRQKVETALIAVGLEPDDFITRKYSQLSGGEAKRVALASRIILQPKVLLLDEPFANIDQESAELIRQALIDMVTHRQISVVISSHNDRSFAKIVNKVIELRNGQLVGGQNADL